MAAMLQQSPVSLRSQQQKEEQEVHLPTFIHNKLRLDQGQEVVYYPQDWQQYSMNNNSSQYYTYQHYPPQIYHASPRQHRVRTQSNPTKSPVQPQKSSSTPNSPHHHRQRKPRSIENNNNNNSNNNNYRRPSKPTINDRRPSKPTTTTTNTNLYNHNNTSASVCSTASSVTSSSIHNNNNNKPPSIDSSSGRRSSITSTTSNKSQAVSIRSEMSIGGSKLSLSKRLRKAFSISNLRSSSSLSLSSSSLGSLDGASSSNVSISTIDVIHENSSSSPSTSSPPPPQRNLRRRSLASLANLFQKNKSSSSLTSPSPISTPPSLSPSTSQSTRRPSITPSLNQKQQDDKKDRPTLRVDTSRPVVTNNQRKPPIKGRSSVIAPDSPNSSISTRSPVTKVVGPHRLAELPSPTPSASSSSSSQQQQQNNDIDLSMAPPPVIGVHYGLPMHGSPRLKPAASSSASSLIIMDNQNTTNSKRRLQFCPTVQVHETFAASDYDRRCDNNSTCQKLTPMIAMKIKQELNEYKLTEMEVHVDSRQYTHFFL